MFVLALRTFFFGDVLRLAGTTVQVPDTFVLDDKVRQVPAPPPPVAPVPVIALAPVIPVGAVRLAAPAVINGAYQPAGTQFPPSTVGPSRTVKVSSGGSKGEDEALYDVYGADGQWHRAGKSK